MKKVLAILILEILYSVIAYGSDTTSGFKVKNVLHQMFLFKKILKLRRLFYHMAVVEYGNIVLCGKIV